MQLSVAFCAGKPQCCSCAARQDWWKCVQILHGQLCSAGCSPQAGVGPEEKQAWKGSDDGRAGVKEASFTRCPFLPGNLQGLCALMSRTWKWMWTSHPHPLARGGQGLFPAWHTRAGLPGKGRELQWTSGSPTPPYCSSVDTTTRPGGQLWVSNISLSDESYVCSATRLLFLILLPVFGGVNWGGDRAVVRHANNRAGILNRSPHSELVSSSLFLHQYFLLLYVLLSLLSLQPSWYCL